MKKKLGIILLILSLFSFIAPDYQNKLSNVNFYNSNLTLAIDSSNADHHQDNDCGDTQGECSQCHCEHYQIILTTETLMPIVANKTINSFRHNLSLNTFIATLLRPPIV